MTASPAAAARWKPCPPGTVPHNDLEKKESFCLDKPE